MIKFKADYKVMTGRMWNLGGVLRLIRHKNLRFCFWGRLGCSSHKLFAGIGNFMSSRYAQKYGLEINFKNIGGGLLLLHPYNITVNSKALLGENVTLFKGVTIGSVRSGKREGVPAVGDRVCLCVNSTVVGNITIGNDVLIAANAMVDFDVPPHSIVIGNPGKIFPKENASADYLSGL